MKRCRHLNVTVFERTVAHLAWTFIGGVLAYDYAEDSFPTGQVGARCRDCGREVWSGNARYLPKWARVCLDKVLEGRGS